MNFEDNVEKKKINLAYLFKIYRNGQIPRISRIAFTELLINKTYKLD